MSMNNTNGNVQLSWVGPNTAARSTAVRHVMSTQCVDTIYISSIYLVSTLSTSLYFAHFEQNLQPGLRRVWRCGGLAAPRPAPGCWNLSSLA